MIGVRSRFQEKFAETRVFFSTRSYLRLTYSESNGGGNKASSRDARPKFPERSVKTLFGIHPMICRKLLSLSVYTYIYTYIYICIYIITYIYTHILYINLPVGDCFFNPFMFFKNIRAKLGLVYDWVCSWHFFASKLVSGRFFSYWVTRTALQQLSSCPRLKICGQPTSKPQSTISLLSLHMRWCSEISHESWSTALGWHWWPDVQGQLWLSPLRLFQYVALFWKQIGGYTKWSSAALSQFRSELALHRTNFIVAPTIQ